MPKLFPLVVILLLPFLSFTQTKRDTLYYTDARFWNYANRKSNYMRILIEENGINTEIQQNLNKNRLYLKKSFKGDEPVGIWQKLTKSGIEYRDYNFTVDYTQVECDRLEDKDPRALLLFDIKSMKYQMPTISFKGDVKTFRVAFRRNWNPPKMVRTQSLKGGTMIKIDAVFTVTSTGEIKDIQIIKSQNILLDKEVVRTLKKMKFDTPPKLDGKAIDICARFPLRIQLQPNSM